MNVVKYVMRYKGCLFVDYSSFIEPYFDCVIIEYSINISLHSVTVIIPEYYFFF